MCRGQVRTQSQSSFSLGKRAFIIAAPVQSCRCEGAVSFRIGTIECDRLAGQGFGRAVRLSPAVCLGLAGRLYVSQSEAPVAAGEGRVEVNSLLKKLLRERVVVRIV